MNINLPETVFNQCGEFVSDRICSSMSLMMQNVEDTLYDMAKTEKSRTKASQYFDAVRIIRLKKYEMQVRFKNRFLSIYQYRVRSFIKNQYLADITFSKVGHHSFTKEKNSPEGKALENTVEKVNVDCQSALLNLDKRICNLLDDVDVSYLGNPLRPEPIFEAFWESCRDVDFKPEIRLLLVNLFERYVGLELKYVYEDLNTYIANQVDISIYPVA
ncbi:MAG: DUF1631 family protein [Gammaproteobacteria bacterium]|nr:DUF1631 family protein [Gammaproteobacteria bacterium]NIQ19804.1 DUF1631 family protein [Gammaproteobacteria bacterium]NIT41425.1 DUF1631 family protein [Gammaproteobacteria bacterium]